MRHGVEVSKGWAGEVLQGHRRGLEFYPVQKTLEGHQRVPAGKWEFRFRFHFR